MLTSKIVGGWVQWPDMQILMKFQVNQMEIDNFRKMACVDLKSDVDIFAYVDLKHNWWFNSYQWRDVQIHFKFEVNRMKIEDFRNLKRLWWWLFDLFTSK